jgi:hypothetical protein
MNANSVPVLTSNAPDRQQTRQDCYDVAGIRKISLKRRRIRTQIFQIPQMLLTAADGQFE